MKILYVNESQTLLDTDEGYVRFEESEGITCTDCIFYNPGQGITCLFPIENKPPLCMRKIRKDKKNGIFKRSSCPVYKEVVDTMTDVEKEIIGILL